MALPPAITMTLPPVITMALPPVITMALPPAITMTLPPAITMTTVALMAGMTAWTTVAPALDGATVALVLAPAITMTMYNTDDNSGYGSYSFNRGGYGHFSCYTMDSFASCHCMITNKPAGIEK